MGTKTDAQINIRLVLPPMGMHQPVCVFSKYYDVVAQLLLRYFDFVLADCTKAVVLLASTLCKGERKNGYYPIPITKITKMLRS